jgi:hypothetical protein
MEAEIRELSAAREDRRDVRQDRGPDIPPSAADVYYRRRHELNETAGAASMAALSTMVIVVLGGTWIIVSFIPPNPLYVFSCLTIAVLCALMVGLATWAAQKDDALIVTRHRFALSRRQSYEWREVTQVFRHGYYTKKYHKGARKVITKVYHVHGIKLIDGRTVTLRINLSRVEWAEFAAAIRRAAPDVAIASCPDCDEQDKTAEQAGEKLVS